ncbi:MAG: ammonia-forming cytochrome c nitrite reductase subunit c552 [Desulfuromonadales bacterium]|nr:ammonia-forming cytochrome c nitrite reductase subunit c552 [Desulfuromonadales bacterium]
MRGKLFWLLLGCTLALCWSVGPVLAADVDPAKCFKCHKEVKELHKDSKHADLGCATCHSGMDAHMKSPKSNKPVTSLELSTCGECHPDQYASFYKVNFEAEPRKEKGTPTGRSPQQDKLLAPHGFTKEHNEPRSHPFMVVDQFVVDRFAGGRYQFKDMFGYTRPGKTWDVLEDTGTTLPQTAKAGNPVCLQCKTSDLTLKWKFLGDKDERAKWDRTSDINELIKDVHNPVGCIQCHDPHATKPRIIRDALIAAVERDGTRPYDADKGAARVKVDVVEFRDFRKIGLLSKQDSNLQCGQCHVEYNCNPGFDIDKDEKFGMSDRRSNHFPMKNAKDLLAHYDELKFRDFKHAVTGARLIKLQHPEMETYWGSVHDKAGVTCADCHMPKQKNASGETFTSHQVVRPKHHVQDSCMGCHPDSSVEEKLSHIQAVQNYTRGKMRKAESALVKLIDTFAEAKKQGVAEAVLAEARQQHEIAHVLWEWWTAENSDGWHNPELAKETLIDCIEQANKGTKVLQAAMK